MNEWTVRRYPTEPRSGDEPKRRRKRSATPPKRTRSENGAQAERERRGPRGETPHSGEAGTPYKAKTRNLRRKAANVKTRERPAGATGHAEPCGAGNGAQLGGSADDAGGKFAKIAPPPAVFFPPTHPLGGRGRGCRPAGPFSRCRGSLSRAAAAALAPSPLSGSAWRAGPLAAPPRAKRSGE